MRCVNGAEADVLLAAAEPRTEVRRLADGAAVERIRRHQCRHLGDRGRNLLAERAGRARDLVQLHTDRGHDAAIASDLELANQIARRLAEGVQTAIVVSGARREQRAVVEQVVRVLPVLFERVWPGTIVLYQRQSVMKRGEVPNTSNSSPMPAIASGIDKYGPIDAGFNRLSITQSSWGRLMPDSVDRCGLKTGVSFALR